MRARRIVSRFAASGFAAFALIAAGSGCSEGSDQNRPAATTESSPTLPSVAAAVTTTPSDPDLIVETRAGKLRGTAEGAVQVYRGIPYGESTAAARFAAPTPRAAWQGVRDAVEFGAICPQRGDVATGLPPDHRAGEIPKLPMSEDCLMLNVWTPAADGSKRPVMVWFHGRGFREGAGSEPWYHGAELAEAGDVVVVTVNHRLNVFGYLNLAELGGEKLAGSGIAGMLDAVLALEWVRDNASAFGGDPGNVTIFGESGGGAKVSTLLAMPGAKGLFQRAIIQSGPGIRATTPEDATETARALLAQLGLEPGDAAKLQTLPVETVLDAVAEIERANPRHAQNLRPVLDPKHLPAHPFDPVAAPSAAGVPVMIGANKDEATLFLAADPKRGTLTKEELVERVRGVIGDKAEAVIAVYEKTRPNATPWDLFVAIGTERTRLGSLLIAERLDAISDAPVYVYSFDWESNFANGFLKAAHAMEIPFVFNHPDRVPLTGDGPGKQELAKLMSQTWVAFARNGDPNHPGLPKWDPYTPEAPITMVLDLEPKAVNDLRKEERLAWEGIGPTRLN